MRISLPLTELGSATLMSGGEAVFSTRVTVTSPTTDQLSRVQVITGLRREHWEEAGRPTTLEVDLGD
jgi:hypothetical protein